MEANQSKRNLGLAKSAFSLVEMLVVIAIISVLMTAGSIGLSGMGGKGVTSGVATAESLFVEARSMAMGRNIRAAVLIAKGLTNKPEEDLRRIVVAHESVDAQGLPDVKPGIDPKWVISSRGAVLPDKTFFSERFSSKDFKGVGEAIDEVTLLDVSKSYEGSYYIYEFNPEGICKTPGASSFVIGSGARVSSRPSSESPPVITASAKRDFAGFVIWRSGQTSIFRSPEQIGTELKNLKSGDSF